jgi:hypothetical protein
MAPTDPPYVATVPSRLSAAESALQASFNATALKNALANIPSLPPVPALSKRAKIIIGVIAGVLSLLLLLLLLLWLLCRGAPAELPRAKPSASCSTQTPAVADIIIPPTAPEPFKVRVFRPQFCEREEEFDEKWTQTHVIPHYNVRPAPPPYRTGCSFSLAHAGVIACCRGLRVHTHDDAVCLASLLPPREAAVDSYGSA